MFNNQNPYNNGQNGYGRNFNSFNQNGPFGNGNFNFGFNAEPPFVVQERNNEKRRLKILSYGAAAATGGFFLLANILYSVSFIFPNLTSKLSAENQTIFTLSLDLIITLISLVIPFAAVYYYNRTKLNVPKIETEKPKVSFGIEAMFIIAGFGALLIGGQITQNLTLWFENITGITFYYSNFDIPTSVFGIVILFLRSAVMPAITEEFAMRGVVMHSLRRYGDLFALTMSAVVFGLMHGNMIQMPFAIIAGYILGYACIKTGSLWTSVIIHLINNAFSVTLSILATNVSEEAGTIFYIIGEGVVLTAAIICCLVLHKKRQLTPPAANKTFLPSKECYKKYILNIPMIAVLIYMLIQTALMIDFEAIA